MNKVAIIPARGGSKRIPGKNKRDFLGQPIIAYAIKEALQSGVFNEVMVFTDDADIAAIAHDAGAKTPFTRDAMNAGDEATLSAVLTEVLHKYRSAGIHPEFVCMILPTAVLLQKQALADAYSLLVNEGYGSVIPVVRFSYPVQRALQFNNKQRLSFIDPQYRFTRSQDLPPAFHDAGQFYWIRTSEFEKERSIFMENTGAVELQEYEVQDIDNETDWKLAELKFALLNNPKH